MSLLKNNNIQEGKGRSDDQIFTQFMNESMDFAYQVARQFIKNPDEIRDAIQVAYIKAWKSFSNFSEDKSLFTTWYYSILRNECIDHLRKQRKFYKEDINQANSLNGDEWSVDIESYELHQQIILLADRLSAGQKEVFLLRDVQGYAIKEVAQITRKSVGSIKTNLYLARKKLRSWIIEEKII